MSATNQKVMKELEVKTNVLKRLIRERSSYEEEVAIEVSRLDRMKSVGKEEADLRVQSEVIRETQAMVPDTHRRMNGAYDELKRFLDKLSNLSETNAYSAAQRILDEANRVLNK